LLAYSEDDKVCDVTFSIFNFLLLNFGENYFASVLKKKKKKKCGNLEHILVEKGKLEHIGWNFC